MTAATGLSSGPVATPELATLAVREAMDKVEAEHVNTVILYLTPEFAHDPAPALLAAARAAECTQVIGCTATGIFTENDWVLDSPAAAAMVLSGRPHLGPASEAGENDYILTLTAPNIVNTAWLTQPGRRFGGVSGDATGQGAYKVWSGGRTAHNGRCEAALSGVHGVVGVSQGALPLCPPREITRMHGFDVTALEGVDAAHSLESCLPPEIARRERIPLHMLMAGITIGDPQTALAEGRYRLVPIVSANADNSITLSTQPQPGEQLFWALREPSAAERDMRLMLTRLAPRLDGAPDFALVFPCMGRSPYFYGGTDLDLDALKAQYPAMPFIGFYGNGEIAPFDDGNHLFQYSTVVGLFRSHVQPDA